MSFRQQKDEEDGLVSEESEDDELGVNDKFFNFNKFKYQGVDLTDLDDPEKMQELFPEKYGQKRGLFNDTSKFLRRDPSQFSSYVDYGEESLELLNNSQRPSGIKATHQSGRKDDELDVEFEFDEIFTGQEIQLAEIDLKDITEVEKQEKKEEKAAENRLKKSMQNRASKVSKVKN